MPMKVLEINSVCGIRSTGRICTDLADVLKEDGHECLIAYGRETAPDRYRDISFRIGSDNDVRLHALRARLFDSAGWGSRNATKRLIGRIREYAPDIIHLHNLHGYYLDLELLFDYLSSAGKPVVWTLHDCWAFTGHCAHFTAAGCDRWKTGCHDCIQKNSYPASVLLDRSKQNWLKKKELFTGVERMTLVTPSKWLAGLVNESFLGRYAVKVIPNGIDLNVFKPTESNFRRKYGLQGKRIVLGAATSWTERKGLNEFIQLAALLDEEYRLVLLGLTPEQIAELPKNILGLTATNSTEELAGIYTAADVFVNAGKEETMGLTTVEAMACGTPAAVSPLTAVPEVVTPDGGIVLDKLTPVAIKDGIEKVLEADLHPRINAEKYEKKQQYLKYLDLYKSIADRGSGNE